MKGTDDDQTQRLSLQNLNGFLLKCYMKHNLGACQRAEQFIVELSDAILRFGKISSNARFLALFFRDEVVNYQIYKQICGFRQEENEFCADAFEVYRLNAHMMEQEFCQIRSTRSWAPSCCCSRRS